MPALDQDTLNAACRALYELAGDHYALPPLTRAAEKANASVENVYHYRIGSHEFCFHVTLDEAHADRNACSDSKLPIKFRAELRCGPSDHGFIALAGEAKYALVRAFLLGVKAPIAAESIDGSACLRFSIQIASTYFVDCGSLYDTPADRGLLR